MRKLIQGIVEFRNQLTDENKNLFAQLALGQTPDALFIACSDSRVIPNLFASTEPGDLFVVRNVGNLVPEISSIPHDHSVPAALEYSVFTLGVSDIIICGHSECGAMRALLDGIESQNLCSWIAHGKESLEKINKGISLDPTLSKVNQLSQINVLQQMEHVRSYPFVQESLEKKQLRVHGWWFDIADAAVYCYESEPNRFVLIDEGEARHIFED